MKYLGLCIFCLLLAAFQASAIPIQKCEICHAKVDFKKVTEDKRTISLHVPADSLASSVHRQRECTDCHRDATEIPHKPGLQRVDCTTCHYIGNLVGAPELALYEEYRESVHGRAAMAGNKNAPVCQDCHGAHNIQVPESEKSPLSRVHLAQSCGRCHLTVYTKFTNSIHGKLLAEGNPKVPTCMDCHGEHSIESPKVATSSVSAGNIPNTCSKCHAAEAIVGEFGLSAEQSATYSESFHGIATTFGSAKAANCASCHGSHDILPPADPDSWVYPANIPKTCGKCHPEANANWARGKIHVDASKKESGIIFYVASFFKWLTIITLVGLVINIILDLARRLLGRKKHQQAPPN